MNKRMKAITTNVITSVNVIQWRIFSQPLFFTSNRSTSFVPTIDDPKFLTLPDCKMINTISVNPIINNNIVNMIVNVVILYIPSLL